MLKLAETKLFRSLSKALEIGLHTQKLTLDPSALPALTIRSPYSPPFTCPYYVYNLPDIPITLYI